MYGGIEYTPYEECAFCLYRSGISCCKGCNDCPVEKPEVYENELE